MPDAKIRPMRPDDWTTMVTKPGMYFSPEPLTCYIRADGLGGNALHPASAADDFETQLAQIYAEVMAAYPGVTARRYAVRMPYWTGDILPTADDYAFVDGPQALTTTSISVIMIPSARIKTASLGFYIHDGALPTLRERLAGTRFQSIAGNLGYFMTAGLIEDRHAWAHNQRFPDFLLPPILSYIGFHWSRDPHSGKVRGGFQGAHPAAVGIRQDGQIDILPDLDIEGYTVRIGEREFVVEAINDPDALDADVALCTPALKSPEVARLIALAEKSAGADEGWQTFAPLIPAKEGDDRVHIFIASEGDGQRPIEKVVTVWQGRAPLPSFGAVLSFKRAYFDLLFGDTATFERAYHGKSVYIVPRGPTDFSAYQQILGGFVPAVVNGEHVYAVKTVGQLMRNLTHFGNATSPIAQAGRESQNFDPRIREPAGLLVQTESQIGWVFFDGRHELSLGASVADVGAIINKLETAGALGGEAVQQAIFIDGGSAMKAYAIASNPPTVRLDLLNRVAAGSRNGPGDDPDGLNLYSLLNLSL